MPGCAVGNCKNCTRKTKGTDIKYFRFPRNEDLIKQWVIACRRIDEIKLKNARVCSLHFDTSCFEIPLKHKLLEYSPGNARTLRADAVPNLNLPGKPQKKREQGLSLKLANRKKQQDIVDVNPVEAAGYVDKTKCEVSKLKERIEVLEKVNKKLENENMKLKKQNGELETRNRELERQNRELEKQYSVLLGPVNCYKDNSKFRSDNTFEMTHSQLENTTDQGNVEDIKFLELPDNIKMEIKLEDPTSPQYESKISEFHVNVKREPEEIESQVEEVVIKDEGDFDTNM